jgi:ATP/maltotriose-dependent transcriptional regulator MalT
MTPMTPITNPLRRRQIERDRLLPALAHWHTFRLVRVVAPAGFGKSTLASQWMRTLSPDETTVVFLPLTATDRDAEYFLRRLHDALEGREARTNHIAAPIPTEEALHDAMSRHPRPILLLLDDVHHVDDSPTQHIVQHLIDDGPSLLHIALFSRTRALLQTRRWQMEGKVLNLTVDDLRFDHEEFTAFASASRLSELDEAQLSDVERRYAGWPAGLQLLLQTLPATRPITDARIRSSTEDAEFFEYLEQDVLMHTPEYEQRMLIETALLPYLSPSLCAGICHHTFGECENLLARIAANNGLVAAHTTPRHGLRYRVHPVLRAFLLRRLSEQYSLSTLREMRRASARALAAHADVDAALELLLPSHTTPDEDILLFLGEDAEAAADIVQAASHDEVWHGDAESVQRWITKIPESVVRTRPRLALDATWAAHHILQVSPRPTLPMLRAAIFDSAIDDDQRAEALVLEALYTLRHGHWQKCASHLRAARSLCHTPNSRAAAYVEGIEACTLLENEPRTLNSRLEQLDHACAIFQRIGYTRGSFDTMNQAIWVSRNYANAPGVFAMAQRALDSYATIGWQSSLYAIYAHLHMSEMLYYMNRIDDARSDLHAARDIAEVAGLSNSLRSEIDVRLQLCDMADGRSIDEMALHEEVQDMSRRQNYVTSGVFTNYRRILRDGRLRHFEYCRSAIESMGVDTKTLSEDHQPAVWLCVLTAAFFIDPTNDDIPSLAEAARQRSEALSQRWIAMHMLLLQALHAQHRGEEDTAKQLLQRLAIDVVNTGMLRILLDFPQLMPLLEQIDSIECRHILTKISRSPTMPSLTAQERRIIEALAEGASTQRIAVDLVVSVETVRTHIRNVMKKLGVHTREEAVQAAQEWGIVG